MNTASGKLYRGVASQSFKSMVALLRLDIDIDIARQNRLAERVPRNIFTSLENTDDEFHLFGQVPFAEEGADICIPHSDEAIIKTVPPRFPLQVISSPYSFRDVQISSFLSSFEQFIQVLRDGIPTPSSPGLNIAMSLVIENNSASMISLLK
ncbi:hypothetical protein THAOC_34042 [Thalassiosira oceanica]|uniref:Uncharacterized protein n=1 Tax=Thalassiosira oceanica TaxID=159749 RepID=K0R361_THAOC|nr:hypothetical protein THAOC_34042 [Thalassiosira oceanica]|eukprot:EJK47248.1 hypothetical protein THAOC_34042 [Thalassiosira oceanica]